ncbi:MAG: DUF1616 domain-containing protein [Candidatus Hydrothermarchaeales archaeon]
MFMGISQILRMILGFALVLFIPGYALTLALWPKTKRDIYEDILRILKERGISSVTIVAKLEDIEDFVSILEENGIGYGIYDKSIKEKKVDEEAVKSSRNLVLMDGLDFEIDRGGKFVVDLANNFEPQEDVIKLEDTIDMIERTTLSFGLSIAIVPPLGIVLDKAGFGIRFGSILVSLVLIIMLFFGIYYYRRRRSEV